MPVAVTASIRKTKISNKKIVTKSVRSKERVGEQLAKFFGKVDLNIDIAAIRSR